MLKRHRAEAAEAAGPHPPQMRQRTNWDWQRAKQRAQDDGYRDVQEVLAFVIASVSESSLRVTRTIADTVLNDSFSLIAWMPLASSVSAPRQHNHIFMALKLL